MEGSDRIFLRNRRFLEKDPSFNTQQLNMLRREVEHEGLGGRGPAEDSTATEFSSEAGLEEQRGGNPAWWRSVTFADSAEAELVAGPRQRPLLLPWRVTAAGERSSLAPRSLLLTS